MNRKLILVACIAAISASSTLSAQRWGRGALPRDGACFYKDTDFHDDYFCLTGGEELGAMSEDVNDKITSIKIFGQAEVTVFTDARFAGDSTRFAGNVRDLKEEKWNDRISSLRVLSGAGANVRPAGDVDQIIRRAYQELLDREPDPQGFLLYRNHMLNDGWSEDRVRETLRNSPEYRTKGGMTVARAQEIVRRAYLEVLKREPDSGSQPYVEKVMRDHWSQQDVERELRKSDEYREKQPL
jgi:hypothetical protein